LEGAEIGATWITVFKQFGPLVLVITPPTEIARIATQSRGQHSLARHTRQRLVVSPL
jgi:hypothetical protein